MAIGAGSTIRFKVFQRVRDQQVLNVFFFDVVDVDPGATVPIPSWLARSFAQQYFAKIRPLQSNQLTYDRVEVDEVNGLDIGSWTFPDPSTGAVAFAALPPQDAISVQFVRGNRTTRHGWKRFAGVPETSTDNGIVTPGLQASWTSVLHDALMPEGFPVLRLDILNDEEEPAGFVDVRLIIWGGNDPGFPTGRKQNVVGFDVKPNISTQNTRKIGRGS